MRHGSNVLSNSIPLSSELDKQTGRLNIQNTDLAPLFLIDVGTKQVVIASPMVNKPVNKRAI